MRISDWSSYVCSSDLVGHVEIAVQHDIAPGGLEGKRPAGAERTGEQRAGQVDLRGGRHRRRHARAKADAAQGCHLFAGIGTVKRPKSEERRVGKEGVMRGNSRGRRNHKKKKKKK